MEYKIKKMVGDKDHVRYVLQTEGANPLVVIGVNPSTANVTMPDRTMLKVMQFAELNGFDSFVMLNLYPQRSPNPDTLSTVLSPSLHTENLKQITQALEGFSSPTILLAFGNLINIRPYLRRCLKEIVDVITPLHPHWKVIRTTKLGNPTHPLYRKLCPFVDFDIDQYLISMGI